MTPDLVIRGGRLVSSDGVTPADLSVRDGTIVAINSPGESLPGVRTIDASGRLVLPGVIDPHLHIGFGNGLDDWQTETRSAAIGGVTTVFSFLMSGASYVPVVAEARAAADRLSYIDYGLHVVPCAPVHLDELDRYATEFGITSFKYFTSFRGAEGAYLGVQGTDDGFLYDYLLRVGRIPGGLACVHPENIEVVWRLRDALQEQGRDDLQAWDESRPAEVEAEACYRAMFYARSVGCPLYLVHVSSALALDEIRAWRARHPDARVYVETCPHFLTHSNDLPLGSLGKINPPLRSRRDVDALWAAVADGTVDTIGSDHVPRRRAKKAGSIWTASAGFPGTAAILPVLLSEGVHRRGLSLERVAELTAANPARIFGCDPRKGTLSVGSDADLTVVDLDLTKRASAEVFQSYADYSLYDGWEMRGWPILTMVRGEVVMDEGRLVGAPGHGRFIERGAGEPVTSGGRN